MSYKILIPCMLAWLLLSTTVKCEKDRNIEKRILWSQTKLTWKDFAGKAIKDDLYKARTFVVIHYDMTATDGYYELDIPCYFVSNLSWSKSKSNKESSLWLLEHEQLHFDIAELHTRKIREVMSKHVSKDGLETGAFLDSVNQLYYEDELLLMNTQYDEETNHGVNRDSQDLWKKRIISELKKLNKYRRTSVKVKSV